MTTKPRRLRPAPAWAHVTGIVNLIAGDRPPWDARSQLAERLHRYCWYFDERRADLLEDCFTEDAEWAGNAMGETVIGPMVGRAEIMSWLTGFWPHQSDQRRHVVTNFIVERQTPTEATGLAYLLLLGSKQSAVALESAGFYSVDYRQEKGTWRISRLTAGFDVPFWKQEVASMEPWVRALLGIREEGPPSATPTIIS